MAIARLHDMAVRLAEKIVAEAHSILQRTSLAVGALIGSDPNDAGQREPR
jgi:hypothetical protein